VRWVALVRDATGGLSPLDGTGKPLLRPDVLLLEAGEEGTSGAMLYGCQKSGDFCGDYWFPSIEAAKIGCIEMFGSIGPWTAVPREVGNALRYAVRWANEQSSPPPQQT